MRVLKNLGADISTVENHPYDKYEEFRIEIRNPLYHVHSSKHDVSYHCEKYASVTEIDSKKDLEKSADMLRNSWINVSSEEAEYL